MSWHAILLTRLTIYSTCILDMLKSDSGTEGDNIIHIPPPSDLFITFKIRGTAWTRTVGSDQRDFFCFWMSHAGMEMLYTMYKMKLDL